MADRSTPAGLEVSESMGALVGTAFHERLSEPITLVEVLRWERAVQWPEHPPQRRPDDVEVPVEFNPFAWHPADVAEPDPSDPDSFIEGLAGGVGPGSTVGVNGELSVTYRTPMRLGDRISAVSRIAGYRIRSGASGPILLTDVEQEWRNQRGDLVKVERNTVIRW